MMMTRRVQSTRPHILCAMAGICASSTAFSHESQVGEWSDLMLWPMEGVHSIFTGQEEVLLWGLGKCAEEPGQPPPPRG